MKHNLPVGATRIFQKLVTEEDLARFNGELVHPVCSTFALAQALEWASRLLVLEMKDTDEEGVGTDLLIRHKHPAFPGEMITISATIQEINNNELVCGVVAKVGAMLIADGETRQKILKKEKLAKLLNPKRA
ncbi:MAG: thioesterase family protein [Adhaeribacter sp.]